MVIVSHFETLKLVNDAQIGYDNKLISYILTVRVSTMEYRRDIMLGLFPLSCL